MFNFHWFIGVSLIVASRLGQAHELSKGSTSLRISVPRERKPANLAKPTQCDLEANGVTYCCNVDGFGAMYGTLVAVYTYAKVYHRPYCSTPWSLMKHSPQWAAPIMWEMIGGPSYGPTTGRVWNRGAFDGPKLNIEPFTAKNIDIKGARPNGLAIHKDPLFWESMDDIRRFYWQAPKNNITLIGQPNTWSVTIAWHIRRGDVEDKRRGDRFTSNEQIIKGLKTLALANGTKNHVHFFSTESCHKKSKFDGIDEACHALGFRSCHWHIDACVSNDAASHFHAMASAQILVTASSSFSRLAGMVSNATVYHDKDLAAGSSEQFPFGVRPEHRGHPGGKGRIGAKEGHTRRKHNKKNQYTETDQGAGMSEKLHRQKDPEIEPVKPTEASLVSEDEEDDDEEWFSDAEKILFGIGFEDEADDDVEND